jgi:TolA-binding protein
MDSEQWEKAERELKKCMDIDRNNTLTLRYLKEVKQMLTPEETGKTQVKRKKDDAVRYQSDNEVIIQPLNVKEPKGNGVSTLVNIGIGLLIGLAVMYFLVVPARVSNARNEAQSSIADIGNQLDAKNVTIKTLESEIDSLTNENDSLHKELDGYLGDEGTLSTIDSLLDAASNYIQNGDAVETGTALEAISQTVEIEETSDAFQSLYNNLLGLVGPELSKTYYTDGYTAYRTEDYNTAIELLSKAVYYDETNRDALYSLAMAYRGNGDDDDAVTTFTRYIELFPQTDRAATAERYINEIQAPSN